MMEMSEEMRRKPNTLPVWGNPTTMNLNTLILTNITNSPYFKGPLSELKTYHEVVDEIYYKIRHLEPWEKGSRRTAGQTGMCGGVRGVGAGGIISTAFCLLYKLFTMKLTRKQVFGLINHTDSPYIRALGFMYVRFTQPPPDLWEWFEPYINDPEEIDVRAGGGQVITIGDMVRMFLTKLDWYSSLFPRIPVPIQIAIDKKLTAMKHATSIDATPKNSEVPVEKSISPQPNSSTKSRSDPGIPDYGHGSHLGGDRSSNVVRSRLPRSKSRSRSRSKSPSSRGRYRERDRSRTSDRRSKRDHKDKEKGSSRHHKDRHRRSSYSRSPKRRSSHSRSPTGSHSRKHKHSHRDRERDRVREEKVDHY